MDIARRHDLFIIEDNAQAIGSHYRFPDGSIKKTGSIGHVGYALVGLAAGTPEGV